MVTSQLVSCIWRMSNHNVRATCITTSLLTKDSRQGAWRKELRCHCNSGTYSCHLQSMYRRCGSRVDPHAICILPHGWILVALALNGHTNHQLILDSATMSLAGCDRGASVRVMKPLGLSCSSKAYQLTCCCSLSVRNAVAQLEYNARATWHGCHTVSPFIWRKLTAVRFSLAGSLASRSTLYARTFS